MHKAVLILGSEQMVFMTDRSKVLRLSAGLYNPDIYLKKEAGLRPELICTKAHFLGGAPTSAPTQELAQKPQCPFFVFFCQFHCAACSYKFLEIDYWEGW
jgi:hypothetical protein